MSQPSSRDFTFADHPGLAILAVVLGVMLSVAILLQMDILKASVDSNVAKTHDDVARNDVVRQTPPEAPVAPTPRTSPRVEPEPVLAVAAKPVGQGVGKKLVFPDVVAKFHVMTEVKQNVFAPTIMGAALSGVGNVATVEKCGTFEHSERWGLDCIEVTLDNGLPRVALYVSNKAKATVENLDKGDSVTFTDCTVWRIRPGPWSTIYCDMP